MDFRRRIIMLRHFGSLGLLYPNGSMAEVDTGRNIMSIIHSNYRASAPPTYNVSSYSVCMVHLSHVRTEIPVLQTAHGYFARGPGAARQLLPPCRSQDRFELCPGAR